MQPAPWIRAWRDFLLDPKVRGLTLEQEGAWWRLLLLTETDGKVLDETGFLGPFLRLENGQIESFVTRLTELGMVTHRPPWIHITHWKQRQFFSDYSTPRVMKHRMKRYTETALKRSSETLRPEETRPEETREERKKREIFIPPTIDEVGAFVEARGYEVDPVAFVAHYEANGWKVGANRMRKWKAAVITWERKARNG